MADQSPGLLPGGVAEEPVASLDLPQSNSKGHGSSNAHAPDTSSTKGFGNRLEIVKDDLTRDINRAICAFSSGKEHSAALRGTIPEVGVLLPVEEGDKASGWSSPSYVPRCLKAAVDMEVPYFGEPYRLLVLQQDWPGDLDAGLPSPAKAILEILELVREHGATEHASAWPLHDPAVSKAVLAMEADELMSSKGMEDMACWRRLATKILRLVRIFTPSEYRRQTLEEQYGPGVAFLFAWSSFFIQQLWILVVYAVIWLCVGARRLRDTDDRWIYELMKAGVVLWCAWLALQSTRRFEPSPHGERREIRHKDFVLGTWRRRETRGERRKRILMLLFVGLPMILGTLVLVSTTFAGVTMLVLRIIFIWGRCLEIHSPTSECRDAAVLHSIVGWAAEVACDVLLALLLELFFALGTAVADWIAGLLNYKFQSDRKLFKGMLELCIAAMERIGFVGSLAFMFVPQWSEPTCISLKPLECSCDDLLLGDNDFHCFQRRLPVDTRRWLFESLMKGPFIVAPFISILVKVVVPRLLQCIARTCSHSRKRECCFWLAPMRGVIRFFTLIFAYDGESVKCFTFVCRGQPFPPLPDEHPLREKVTSVLTQFKVKGFEVEDELMELEMGLLWVVFFMPLLPQGVMVTMVAKLLEVNGDLTKMLYVRRRPVPVDDMTMRRELNAYSWCVVVAGLAWTAGLSLITYNDDLYKWGGGGVGIFVGMILFMLLGSAITVWTVNRCSPQPPARLSKVLPQDSAQNGGDDLALR
uniref:Anoctamin transmembrane domain-containing protein n=1 Tax=Alexandrium monilatum TaxID=311494 RepID=A0A7S4QN82_9DINO